MSGLASALRVYLALVAASLRSQMQYRVSFLIRSFVDALVVISDFLPIFFLVDRFGNLEGWSFAELALLYGMVATSWAIVEMALFGFENFSTYLLEGHVDRWLLRPRPVMLQVSSYQFEARKLGRLAQGMTVLGLAIWHLGLGVAALGWIGLGVVGGVLFFTGVVLLGAASSFWTLGHTSELQNMLTYGGSAALSYPVSVYTRWFRRVLTYGIPMAFVNYFPALAALDRTAAAGWPAWMPLLSPFACFAMLLAGASAFQLGLRRYESTGT